MNFTASLYGDENTMGLTLGAVKAGAEMGLTPRQVAVGKDRNEERVQVGASRPAGFGEVAPSANATPFS